MLGSNNNLSMGDIFPLITTPYEAIPSSCYASASIISNSSNGMLNPRGEFFLLVSTPLNITLNYHANIFSLDTIPTARVLNPRALTFVPLCPGKRNCVILAILVTLLLLLILLFMHLITTDNHEYDGVNPKHLLKKLKHDNPNKITIGHLNINSIRIKFEFLKEIIGNNIAIFSRV